MNGFLRTLVVTQRKSQHASDLSVNILTSSLENETGFLADSCDLRQFTNNRVEAEQSAEI